MNFFSRVCSYLCVDDFCLKLGFLELLLVNQFPVFRFFFLLFTLPVTQPSVSILLSRSFILPSLPHPHSYFSFHLSVPLTHLLGTGQGD